MSYRLYWRNNRKNRQTSLSTGKIRDYIKKMELALKKHLFSGHAPILVNDFLERFVKESNIQGMRKAQEFITAPSLKEALELRQ